MSESMFRLSPGPVVHAHKKMDIDLQLEAPYGVNFSLIAHCHKLVEETHRKVSVQSIVLEPLNGGNSAQIARLVYTDDNTPFCNHSYTAHKLITYLQHKSPQEPLCYMCDSTEKQKLENHLIEAGDGKKRERTSGDKKGDSKRQKEEEVIRIHHNQVLIPERNRYHIPPVTAHVEWVKDKKDHETLHLTPSSVDPELFKVLNDFCTDKESSAQLAHVWSHYSTREKVSKSAPLSLVLLLNKSRPAGANYMYQLVGFAMYATKVYDTPLTSSSVITEALQYTEFLDIDSEGGGKEEESELTEGYKMRIVNVCQRVYEDIKFYYEGGSTSNLGDMLPKWIQNMTDGLGPELVEKLDYEVGHVVEWLMKVWTQNESIITEWEHVEGQPKPKTVECYSLVYCQRAGHSVKGSNEKRALKHISVTCKKVAETLLAAKVPVTHAYVSIPQPTENARISTLQYYGFRTDEREKALFLPGLVSPNILKSEKHLKLGDYTRTD